MLWRFEWEGRVCSGDMLTPLERIKAQSDPNSVYLIHKGEFIRFLIYTIWGSILLVVFSVICLAFTLKNPKVAGDIVHDKIDASDYNTLASASESEDPKWKIY